MQSSEIQSLNLNIIRRKTIVQLFQPWYSRIMPCTDSSLRMEVVNLALWRCSLFYNKKCVNYAIHNNILNLRKKNYLVYNMV